VNRYAFDPNDDPIDQAAADLAELAAESRFVSLAAIADRWHSWLDGEASR
jgi:hypothetical protein